MLRRLTERHKHHALRLLNGTSTSSHSTLYGLPHRDDHVSMLWLPHFSECAIPYLIFICTRTSLCRILPWVGLLKMQFQSAKRWGGFCWLQSASVSSVQVHVNSLTSHLSTPTDTVRRCLCWSQDKRCTSIRVGYMHLESWHPHLSLSTIATTIAERSCCWRLETTRSFAPVLHGIGWWVLSNSHLSFNWLIVHPYVTLRCAFCSSRAWRVTVLTERSRVSWNVHGWTERTTCSRLPSPRRRWCSWQNNAWQNSVSLALAIVVMGFSRIQRRCCEAFYHRFNMLSIDTATQ